MDRDNGPGVQVPEQRAPRERAVETTLRFAVLGPVRSWRDGEPLPSGSPQQRALLAALLLRDGRTATASELIDALWGEDPPSQALATVRTYASRLRKSLGQDTLVSESGGYAVRIPRDTLDLTLAQDRAAEAEKARSAGDAARPARCSANSSACGTAKRSPRSPARTRRTSAPGWRSGASSSPRPGSTWTWRPAATRRPSPN